MAAEMVGFVSQVTFIFHLFIDDCLNDILGKHNAIWWIVWGKEEGAEPENVRTFDRSNQTIKEMHEVYKSKETSIFNRIQDKKLFRSIKFDERMNDWAHRKRERVREAEVTAETHNN